VFLASTPPTRARLTPLHSLWLDTLILRLMDGAPSAVKTWFILDEVQTLNRLPQLHTALTENRKWNNPVVLGCQGKSQLEVRYGHDAQAIMAQPATQITLATKEPEAAAWAEKMIGHIEVERVGESRRNHWGFSNDNTTFTLQRTVEPLVMASQIQGLPDLHAYLKNGNLVAPFRIAYPDLPQVAEAFVPRRAPEIEVAPHQPVTGRVDVQTLE
jgi:type IV secretory pathway TraG/TraD family ATPase VirD4